MDLKFTFKDKSSSHSQSPETTALAQNSRQLPFALSKSTTTSNELFIKVVLHTDMLLATAVSGDGHEYAKQSRPLTAPRPSMAHTDNGQSTFKDNTAATSAATNTTASAAKDPDVSAYLSVIARAVAELGDKLATAITEVRMEAAALIALQQAGYIDALSLSTQSFARRTGITQATLVRCL